MVNGQVTHGKGYYTVKPDQQRKIKWGHYMTVSICQKNSYGAWGHWGKPYYYLMDKSLADGNMHVLTHAEVDISVIEKNL